MIPKGSVAVDLEEAFRCWRQRRERKREMHPFEIELLVMRERVEEFLSEKEEVSREDLLKEIEHLWKSRVMRESDKSSMEHGAMAVQYRAAREAAREAKGEPEQMWLKVMAGLDTEEGCYTYMAGCGERRTIYPDPADIRTDPADDDEFAPIPTQGGK